MSTSSLTASAIGPAAGFPRPSSPFLFGATDKLTSLNAQVHKLTPIVVLPDLPSTVQRLDGTAGLLL